MSAAILLAVVLAGPLPPKGAESHFDKREWSAEGIWVAIQRCLESMNTAYKADIGEQAALSYCACSIDAARAKGVRGATVADLTYCAQQAQRRFPKQTAGGPHESTRVGSGNSAGRIPEILAG